MREWVFWQRIVSPHMAGLARARATRGGRVTYVAASPISAERLALGWSAPELPGVNLELVPDERRARALASEFPEEAVHLTQGLRRNGYVGKVIPVLLRRRARWGAVMETVDDRGWRGILRRVDYSRALGNAAGRPDFVLAIGERTPAWIEARGLPAARAYPFTYFLDPSAGGPGGDRPAGPFRIGYAGNLIRLKRVDLLIDALSGCSDSRFEFVVIGGGLLEAALRGAAESALGRDRVRWLGTLSRAESISQIAALDLLVLPSDHDGWGAVVTEALMSGVTAICSDACGAAAAVRGSGRGGVFPSGDARALRSLIEEVLTLGPQSREGRSNLARWAGCLSTEAGAPYLESVIAHVYDGGARPAVPWQSVEAGR